MGKRYPGPGPYTFKDGRYYFKSPKIMGEFRAANPDCTCYYDDYDCHMDPVADCPGHGEGADFVANHAYGSANCRCEKTGPERTWNNALDCPLHGPQDVAVAADTYRPPPTHYAGAGGIDPWTFIRAHGLDYWQGNIIKYVTRAGKKDGESKIKDLEKARDFLNYLIEMESSP